MDSSPNRWRTRRPIFSSTAWSRWSTGFCRRYSSILLRHQPVDIIGGADVGSASREVSPLLLEGLNLRLDLADQRIRVAVLLAQAGQFRPCRGQLRIQCGCVPPLLLRNRQKKRIVLDPYGPAL